MPTFFLSQEIKSSRWCNHRLTQLHRVFFLLPLLITPNVPIGFDQHWANVTTELCIITQDLEPQELAGTSQLITSHTDRTVCLTSHLPPIKFILHFIIPPFHFRTSFCTSLHSTLVFATSNSLLFCQNSSLFYSFLFQFTDVHLKQPKASEWTLQYSTYD